jgi:hypothetical protein
LLSPILDRRSALRVVEKLRMKGEYEGEQGEREGEREGKSF